MRLLPLIVSAATLLPVIGQAAHAQNYYQGKTVTLFAGQPPGGGIDAEMRLVAQFFGKFLPGEPAIIARNMPGAGGMVLGNHLFGVAAPDGLTLGMPGRTGFVLAPVIGVGDVKYDLKKFTWIGSSASTNYILWLRKNLGIRSFEEFKANTRQIVIGGSGAGTANSVVPEVLAKYEGFPLKVVRGYPGTNDAVLAMERGEVDGMFVHRASVRPDLIASGYAVPIFQTFALEPNLPVLERFISNPREVALLDLLNAPQRLGLAVIAPPAVPADVVNILRQSYLRMAASKDYQDEAGKRGIDVGKPNSGEELADYVATKLSAFAAETIKEYRDYVERQ